ncbi:MAG: NAD-dependent epimerase/dehydratase family protein [Pseudomonadales bacterium]|nr:NAD-dependent epimerase/dehydratase family protein [Pseudomonadales bacterium]
MPAISGPDAGAVAVTGASGFIGAHVVKNLVENGYQVRACVRDSSLTEKMAYLMAIDEKGPGSIELFSCDLMRAAEGAYDEAFIGCAAVFHVAADIGTNKTYGSPSPEVMYEGLLAATAGVLESCRKAGTVKRVVYTSSTAAVMGPGLPDRPVDFEYTEDDWAGGSYETLEQRYTSTNRKGETFMNWNIQRSSYAKGKVDAEKFGYEFGETNGIDVVSVCPCHVLGPLMGKPHDTVWQHRIGLMLAGTTDFPSAGMNWNIIDVRDIAEIQRLAATSHLATNGSRYMAVAHEESGEPTMQELLDTLGELFPNFNIAGDYVPDQSDTRLRAKCTKAINELGLKPHNVLDTLRDTGNSLIDLGCIEPALK